jgi:hypothetical protein
MIEQTDLAGSFTVPGSAMTVNRMGYGAMQLAGGESKQTLVERVVGWTYIRRQSWPAS